MRVRFWGVRGSVPVSGPLYKRFGGDTTCLEVQSPEGTVIIDAGTGLRGLGNELALGGQHEIHLLLTHFHWDHILGLLFFKPLYDSRFSITIHGPAEPKVIEETLAGLMRQPYFPVPFERVRASLLFAQVPLAGLRIAGMEVTSIPLRHPSPCRGYGLEDDSGKLAFLTDNELWPDRAGDMMKYADFARRADLLVHDAEYTEEEYRTRHGWGHSSFQRALDLALASEAKRFALFHHNQDRSDADVEVLADQCGRIAADAGSSLHCFAAEQGQEIVF